MGHPRIEHPLALVDPEVLRRLGHLHPRPRERLKDQPPPHPPAHDVEPEQRVAQVVEDAHEEHEVPGLIAPREVIDLHLPELDPVRHPELAGRPPRLVEVVGVVVDPGDPRSAPRELDRVEPRVASDVEGRPSREVRGQEPAHLLSLVRREVAQEVVGRGLCAVRQMKVVKPGTEGRDLLHKRRRRVREGLCHG